MVFERVWWILAWYSSHTTPYSEILGCNPRKHTQTLVYVALSSTEIETKWEKNGIFVCGCISICVVVFGWGTFSCWSCWCTAIMWKWCTYIPPGFAWKIRLWTMQCGNIRMNHQGSLKSIQRCNGHVGKSMSSWSRSCSLQGTQTVWRQTLANQTTWFDTCKHA